MTANRPCQRATVQILAFAFLVATLTPSAFAALTINATYIDSSSHTWTSVRKAAIEQAISDWEALIYGIDDGAGGMTSISIDVDIDFTNVSGGYLGLWNGSFPGSTVGDVRPWSSEVSQRIHINSAYIGSSPNGLWFDPTPGDDGSDKGFNDWDVVTVARHEIGHMLGFNTLYDDDVGSSSRTNRWENMIVNDRFDPDGLDVPMEPGDPAHVLENSMLMDTSLSNAEGRIDISDTELTMLSLVYGYKITAIPEPSTMLAVGLVGAGLLLRRRRPVMN